MSAKDLLTVSVGNKALWFVVLTMAAFFAVIALEIRWPGEVLRVARGLKEIIFEPSKVPPQKDDTPPTKKEVVPSDPDPPKRKEVEIKIKVESETKPASSKKKRNQRIASRHKHDRLKPIEFWRKRMPIFASPLECEVLAYRRC